MNSKNTADRPIGVIGSGSFGTVIANLLAENHEVILYTRRTEVVEAIHKERFHNKQQMHPRVHATTDLQEVGERCTLIFPVVPSKVFRTVIQNLAKYLTPAHILIHGIKGLDVVLTESEKLRADELKLSLDRIKTMSQVMLEETCVLRVGCISGPNLAREIARKLPSATVIASHFDEVIAMGKWALRSDRFMVFDNRDLVGVELAGVLKNILALGSGMVSGLDLGENARILDRAATVFEKQLGTVPKGYRSPSWEMTPDVLGLLAERNFR
ncbi:MAG: NAD(P)-binding domain-containing protein, partial [Bacteroidota bacterium]